MKTTEEATKGLFVLAGRVPLNIAPEKAEELVKEVFGNDEWELRPSRTKANFYAVVEERAVYLSFAGLASLWCLTFTAYCVMDIASRSTRDNDFQGSQIDISNQWNELKLDAYLNYARRLFRADEQWPEGLRAPVSDAEFDSVDGRINNLFYGSLSWILLHEIAHIYHGDLRLLPASMKVVQEFRADEFATNWILDNAGSGRQREFRALAITVAHAWLLLHEATIGRGYDHPLALQRFLGAVNQLELKNRSTALENAAYMLKAIFDPESVMPTALLAHEAFEWVSKRIAEQFRETH